MKVLNDAHLTKLDREVFRQMVSLGMTEGRTQRRKFTLAKHTATSLIEYYKYNLSTIKENESQIGDGHPIASLTLATLRAIYEKNIECLKNLPPKTEVYRFENAIIINN